MKKILEKKLHFLKKLGEKLIKEGEKYKTDEDKIQIIIDNKVTQFLLNFLIICSYILIITLPILLLLEIII